MSNFSTESTWENNEARCKLENAHGYIGVTYGIVAVLAGLGFVLSLFKQGANFEALFRASMADLGGLAILALLIFAHFKTRNALEDRKSWAISVSAVLMVPALFAFPIGTAIAIYAYINLLKINDR